MLSWQLFTERVADVLSRLKPDDLVIFEPRPSAEGPSGFFQIIRTADQFYAEARIDHYLPPDDPGAGGAPSARDRLGRLGWNGLETPHGILRTTFDLDQEPLELALMVIRTLQLAYGLERPADVDVTTVPSEHGVSAGLDSSIRMSRPSNAERANARVATLVASLATRHAVTRAGQITFELDGELLTADVDDDYGTASVLTISACVGDAYPNEERILRYVALNSAAFPLVRLTADLEEGDVLSLYVTADLVADTLDPVELRLTSSSAVQAAGQVRRQLLELTGPGPRRGRGGASAPSSEDRLAAGLAELDGFVGLAPVKEQVRAVIELARLNERRREQGLPVPPISRHLVFTGNPGTGKTSVARIVGELYGSLGLLSRGHLVEVSRADLVGQYRGETTVKTQKAIQQALGGVLFIDEAHSLAGAPPTGAGAEPEAVDVLVKAMEDHRDDLVVIAAGYPREMARLLLSNAGLESRFSRTIHFPDLAPDELAEVFRGMVAEAELQLAPDAGPVVTRELRGKAGPGGNARAVRHLFESAVYRQALRLARHPEDDGLQVLTAEDIAGVDDQDSARVADALARLDAMVGLDDLKAVVHSAIQSRRIQEARRQRGLPVDPGSQHLVFVGGPGTGKTTGARLLAKVYAALGVLSRGHLVEVTAVDLIGQFVGHTPGRTLEAVHSALGGVLLLDEAHTLAGRPGDTSYGLEAIDALMTLMEEHASELVVIAAGPAREMVGFLQHRPGLASRFGRMVVFPDFTDAQLVRIFVTMAERAQYRLDEQVPALLDGSIAALRDRPQFGNARDVRNLFVAARAAQEARLASRRLSTRSLRLLSEDDVRSALATLTDVTMPKSPAGLRGAEAGTGYL